MASIMIPPPVAPPTVESLTQELEHSRDINKRIDRELVDYIKLIAVLIAAEHITQHQVDAARSLIFETRS